MKFNKILVFIFILGLFSGTAFVLGWNVGFKEPRSVVLSATTNYISEQELYSKVTDFKTTKGLTSPTIEQSLCTLAEMRLGQITRNWSHDGVVPLWNSSFRLSGTTQSENLAKGYSNSQEILNSWIASPTHLKVLMTNDTHLCIRCANIDGTNYCVYESAY